MIEEARQYLANRSIARREPLYSANRFARCVGDIPAANVTIEHLNEMRRKLVDAGLSNRTIESTVCDVITVVAFVTGKPPGKGDVLKVEAPDPQPVGVEEIDATFHHCEPEIRAYIAFGYWSALRMSDAIRWLHAVKPTTETISIVASKTGKRHRFPYPQWLRSIVTACVFPWRVTDFAKRTIRHKLAMACHKAGVAVWCPKELRQRGITEWSRANAMAGSLVHGTGMAGVLRHYIEPLSVLESAASRVRLPKCFGAVDQTGEESLLCNFRRLDSAAQGLLVMTAERLVG